MSDKQSLPTVLVICLAVSEIFIIYGFVFAKKIFYNFASRMSSNSLYYQQYTGARGDFWVLIYRIFLILFFLLILYILYSALLK